MRKLLIIDNDTAVCKTIEHHLKAAYGVHAANSAAAGLREFETYMPGVVILDKKLPDADGLGLLEKIRGLNENAYVIVLTSCHDMNTTIEAVKKGAFDCIAKPVNMDELELSVKKAFHNFELHRRLKDLLADVYSEYKVDAIIGKSRVMEGIFKAIGVASQSKVTVLIHGESGTGKELIARAIHYNSAEKDRPFLALNCSALVETLLESELFGHEKGAFTGAVFRKEGKFELAGGGTVFLDEVGEMSPALQVKLLRVLQDRTYERVGGSETLKADVRVIAATHRDLFELISRGLFREDLYYRLKVMTIDVPPLRERKEDIPLLVAHLLEKADRELHKHVKKAPEAVMEELVNYPWPGNVRELENVITRAVLLAKGDVLLDVYLPGAGTPGRNNGDRGGEWRPAPMAEVEKEHIKKALVHTDWNKSRAALLLGMTLPRLSRKIRKYGLLRGR